MSANKRVSLSIKQKLSIISELKSKTKQEICVKYGWSIDTVNRMLRNENAIIHSSKSSVNLSRKKIIWESPKK